MAGADLLLRYYCLSSKQA